MTVAQYLRWLADEARKRKLFNLASLATHEVTTVRAWRATAANAPSKLLDLYLDERDTLRILRRGPIDSALDPYMEHAVVCGYAYRLDKEDGSYTYLLSRRGRALLEDREYRPLTAELNKILPLTK